MCQTVNEQQLIAEHFGANDRNDCDIDDNDNDDNVKLIVVVLYWVLSSTNLKAYVKHWQNERKNSVTVAVIVRFYIKAI